MTLPAETAPAEAVAPETAPRLIPPENGCTVRMYRIGHGDCFLLAFAGEKPEKPVYVLIDCGYKPGSPQRIPTPTQVKEITRNIREATGGHLDVAVITHEHQDHVNGITEANFAGITIGETWLAWTEDPEDKLANRLREINHDKLLGLLASRNHLAAAKDTDGVKNLDTFLEFELGGDDAVFDVEGARTLFGAAATPGESQNKRSMRLFKERAQQRPRYLRPHEGILTLPGALNARVFALGPPHDQKQLEDLDPLDDEAFHRFGLGAASPDNYFAAAAVMADAAPHLNRSPFANRYCVRLDEAAADPEHGGFYCRYYEQPPAAPSAAGIIPTPEAPQLHPEEAAWNAPWRRIGRDWLQSAGELALAMNNATNNASLVLAFELGRGGKVLLFAADAQRGNWVSWAGKDWQDGDKTVTARDLLARTVLYKVGHHGSHNATLNGTLDSTSPNLEWMGRGEYAQEFTAMITAVRAWAETQKGWDHPLASIKAALLAKTSGRLFQTDTDFDKMAMVPNGIKADWDRFQSHARGEPLYFDYSITP